MSYDPQKPKYVGFNKPSFDNSSYRTNAQSQVTDNTFYTKVMTWVFISIGTAALATNFIGPLVPTSLMTPLWFVALGALLVAGFARNLGTNPIFTGVMAIAIPAILGVMLYPTINYYTSVGNSEIISLALIGTAIIFGGMALIGWTSKVNLNSWIPKLTLVLIGLIVVSILNVLFFQLSGLAFIISLIALPLFAIYTFIDIQMIRDDNGRTGIPASFYALHLFLNLYNIFVSLLNIMGHLSRD